MRMESFPLDNDSKVLSITSGPATAAGAVAANLQGDVFPAEPYSLVSGMGEEDIF